MWRVHWFSNCALSSCTCSWVAGCTWQISSVMCELDGMTCYKCMWAYRRYIVYTHAHIYHISTKSATVPLVYPWQPIALPADLPDHWAPWQWRQSSQSWIQRWPLNQKSHWLAAINCARLDANSWTRSVSKGLFIWMIMWGQWNSMSLPRKG